MGGHPRGLPEGGNILSLKDSMQILNDGPSVSNGSGLEWPPNSPETWWERVGEEVNLHWAPAMC